MTFEELLDQAIALLQRRGRVTYRTLKRQFQLDDDVLADLQEELIYGQRLAVDEDGRVLVWTGGASTSPELMAPPPPYREEPSVGPLTQATSPLAESHPSEAERRQLTVLFCDLVDSTGLASQLDPEDLREVVQAYQATCARVIARFEGHIAQYLGDGLLVYFGYPLAHEDDAQRAVRAGLGMVEALGQLNTRLERERGVHLAVRLGIHTGLVVVGDVGGGTRQEQLALGETPNLAARLQGIATANTLVISAATFHLLGGFFACKSLGTPPLRGLAQLIEVYQVLSESTARSRLEAAGSTGLTPLVGRDQEVGLLLERWAQVKDGVGQVVLLSGEAGIGKSRLVQVLQEHVAAETQAWLTPCQCSPYYRNTALYPMIDVLERLALRFEREETPPQKRRKLEGFLVQYGLPLAEAVPLFAGLLSLPLAADYAPLTMSPEQQKQQTLQALVTIMRRIAAQQPMLFVMEDVHWVDPTTLEFLSLLVDQGPTARILALWTFRPDFSPPWTGRSHLTQVTLHRLPQRQAAEMAERVVRGKVLPPEVIEQVVAKTDGVPLFVEELTKMVLESGLLQEQEDRYELTAPLPPLAIPATLHDSLMARLDRLAAVKGLAQLGATLGREFSYELLQAVSPWDEGALRRGLQQLVAAEFLYQQGLPPQATYLFKHALIQEAAYQSLLKRTRQRHHRHIAQVLEVQFPDLAETQPELLAYHFTEGGLVEQALPYWQRAGERAMQRSAHVEAIAHLTKGLALLQTLPDTIERAEHELLLQTTLGPALIATKGYAAPEVEQAYARAQELCQQQVGETSLLFPVLWALWALHSVRGRVQTAHGLAEQLLRLAQSAQDPALLAAAHRALGTTLHFQGAFASARVHLEHGMALYDPQQYCSPAFLSAEHPGIICQCFLALTLWYLGYPEQALRRIHDACMVAQQLAHAYSLVHALDFAAWLHQHRREEQLTQERAAATLTLATEQGFAFFVPRATAWRGWALVEQGHVEHGIAQIRQAITNRAIGVEDRQYCLTVLAEAHGKAGQTAEGLRVLAEVFAVIDSPGACYWEAEVYRLKGKLLLALPAEHHAEAEACFQQALDVSRQQQAKSLELRAAMSLACLWQRQGKRAEARELLAPIYGWFTEGFDTADLQEAKALLDELV